MGKKRRTGGGKILKDDRTWACTGGGKIPNMGEHERAREGGKFQDVARSTLMGSRTMFC